MPKPRHRRAPAPGVWRVRRSAGRARTWGHGPGRRASSRRRGKL